MVRGSFIIIILGGHRITQWLRKNLVVSCNSGTGSVSLVSSSTTTLSNMYVIDCDNNLMIGRRSSCKFPYSLLIPYPQYAVETALAIKHLSVDGLLYVVQKNCLSYPKGGDQ